MKRRIVESVIAPGVAADARGSNRDVRPEPMRKWDGRLARALLAVLVSGLLLHGCQCGIPVSVRGSLDSGIIFALHESRDVTYAGVMTRDDLGQWQEIWRIEGEDDLATISYGQVTSGLSTIIAAQELRKNQVYTFQVQDGDFWAPCVGSVTFVVTELGAIEE